MSERIGIVGLGLLGRGIAACFLRHGFHVVAVDRTEEQLAHARDEIGRMLGEIPAERYTASTDFATLADCTFIVESVTEDSKVKDEALRTIEAVVGAATVIGSNTSAIPISQLQARLTHPARFLGMHWAEPAHLTRFMELICGAQTSPEALATTEALARRLGKDPCVCRRDVPGFIVNRIGYAMYCEALSMLDSGVADAETIDRAMRNAFGLWATVCGPFRWMDITGGPALYAKAMQPVLPTLANAAGMMERIQQLAESGGRGIIDGRGFFNYTAEEARHWEELYRRHAARVAEMQNEYFPLSEETPPQQD
jgi:3-hydroxybutyryl-CoA dehydrogenase